MMVQTVLVKSKGQSGLSDCADLTLLTRVQADLYNTGVKLGRALAPKPLVSVVLSHSQSLGLTVRFSHAIILCLWPFLPWSLVYILTSLGVFI